MVEARGDRKDRGGGRLVVARDIDVLCDALADYEPETPSDAVAASAELRAALDELRAVKRLLFV